MKNSEWGAIVYLTHAIGKTGEVWINPNSNYITGQAGVGVSVTSTTTTTGYSTSNGIHASTTDTVYGIYDMAGGAWEYTMGAIDDGTGSPVVGNSGFSILPDSKYYDLYKRGSVNTDGNSNYIENWEKKGDAVYETSTSGVGTTSWFSDNSYFGATTSSWFIRGGHLSSRANAGLFSFSGNSGGADIYAGFRVTISSP